MTLADFKTRIAKKYNTYSDNLILHINDKQYQGSNSNEENVLIQGDLGINEYAVVKVTFKHHVKV